MSGWSDCDSSKSSLASRCSWTGSTRVRAAVEGVFEAVEDLSAGSGGCGQLFLLWADVAAQRTRSSTNRYRARNFTAPPFDQLHGILFPFRHCGSLIFDFEIGRPW